MKVEFDVIGLPAPQGSKRGFVNPRTHKVIMVESSKKVRPWRDDVARAAEIAMSDHAPMTGPIRLIILFYFARPAGHFRANGTLRPSAPAHKITYPDLSKLVRSSEDALTGRAWRDDAQVVKTEVSKDFGVRSGAHIVVEEIE